MAFKLARLRIQTSGLDRINTIPSFANKSYYFISFQVLNFIEYMHETLNVKCGEFPPNPTQMLIPNPKSIQPSNS